MTSILRVSVVAGCVVLAAVGLRAQGPANGQAPQPQAGRGGGAPQGPANLKVLPETWTGQQVRALMQTFAESMGVQCSHCHAEDPAAPAPEAGQAPRLDYALDAKPEKDIARRMIQMVMDINGTDLSGIGDPAVAEKVSCYTCHRGSHQPPFTPEGGWGRGSFSLSDAGPTVPQRGGGAGRGGPGGPPAGGN